MELRPWSRAKNYLIYAKLLDEFHTMAIKLRRNKLTLIYTIVKFCIIDYLRSEKCFIGELRTQFSSPPGWTPTPICICHSLSYDLCLNPLGVDEKKFFLAYQN